MIAVLVLLTSLLLLSGCGFKPRGSGYDALSGQQIILFTDNPFGALERSIKATLRAYAVDISTSSLAGSPDLPNSDDNGIQISHIQIDKNVLSVDVNGRPVEYETLISVTVNFSFKKAVDTKQLPQQFSIQRDYRYDKNNTLADDRELEKLIAEMYDELGTRIISQYSRQLTGL